MSLVKHRAPARCVCSAHAGRSPRRRDRPPIRPKRTLIDAQAVHQRCQFTATLSSPLIAKCCPKPPIDVARPRLRNQEQLAPAADVGGSYQEDRPYLIRFLLRHGATFPEAEDAVQSAFVELMRARQSVQRPRAWLRTVALRAFCGRWCRSSPSKA
ncbi:sigma factor [Streptomyces phaeochromogenes]|uniref:sigma factor n=1 Tax=Streptomyces phaeochromogenes TaxID=1923 RepID=UPI0039A3119E